MPERGEAREVRREADRYRSEPSTVHFPGEISILGRALLVVWAVTKQESANAADYTWAAGHLILAGHDNSGC